MSEEAGYPLCCEEAHHLIPNCRIFSVCGGVQPSTDRDAEADVPPDGEWLLLQLLRGRRPCSVPSRGLVSDAFATKKYPAL